MLPIYREIFHGIHYEAPRGRELTITAPADEFYFAAWDGVLNLMSRQIGGRTAVFVADCDFYQGTEKLTIKVKPGTASYMKELSRLRPLSAHEAKTHSLGRLW